VFEAFRGEPDGMGSEGDEEIITMDTEIYSSSSEEETFQLGIDFSMRLNAGDVIAFYGELGAGKTEFIKGICQGMNVDEIVSSPTYTIVNQYEGEDRRRHAVEIYHVDLYRIENAGELLEVGLYDLLADDRSIKLIEWAENAESILPAIRYDIYFVTLDDENARRIEIVHRDAAALERDHLHVLSRR
jgi:tRNA threonylcarbamoyladenosine biosynthesis protein TsaE